SLRDPFREQHREEADQQQDLAKHAKRVEDQEMRDREQPVHQRPPVLNLVGPWKSSRTGASTGASYMSPPLPLRPRGSLPQFVGQGKPMDLDRPERLGDASVGRGQERSRSVGGLDAPLDTKVPWDRPVDPTPRTDRRVYS